MADSVSTTMELQGTTEKPELNTEEKSGDSKDQDVNIKDLNADPFKKPVAFAVPSSAVKIRSVQNPQKSKTTVISDNHTKSDTSAGHETQDTALNKDPTSKPGSNDLPESQNQTGGAEKHDGEKQIHEKPKKPDIKDKMPARPVKVPPSGKFPPLPYSEPPWAGMTSVAYSFELLKNGAIQDTVPLTKQSYFVVGRLPVCDISLEHPSISRYHAVVQYRGQEVEDGGVGEELGFYVYDLGSTHGTFVNKNKIPPKTYIRLRVGHVVKFGGSTRLFILQGPESDEEAESELTVTELREQARKQKEELEKRMMGDGSDDDDDENEEKDGEKESCGRSSSEDTGCSWGMEEDAVPEEEENEDNPFATEFQEDQEAAYLKDPKKALQGFYDREGEELEFEYDDQGHGTWLCRIKLPVDDAVGRQLVAEVTHVGKKKEAAVQCCLEACRMLEARGLLRQEAVSRKRKKKNWEDDDYYDSDDDSFLDRTGTVEKKRKERMKKAGKIQERPETFESLVSKLAEVEKELAETEKTLRSSDKSGSSSSTEDSLEAFMSSVRSPAALDGVQRKKMHLHVSELKKESQRLKNLIELTRPTQLPSLHSRSAGESSDSEKPKKIALPLFGAMKGGSKFKLKTGTIGKLPPKKPNLPSELFNMKELPPGEEEEEEEEPDEHIEKQDQVEESKEELKENSAASESEEMESVQPDETRSTDANGGDQKPKEPGLQSPKAVESERQTVKRPSPHSKSKDDDTPPVKKSGKKIIGPSRPPSVVSKQYPEDDPDYCVWVPPSGQTGDGRTHLNDKYGY